MKQENLNELSEKYPELAKMTVSDVLYTEEYEQNFSKMLSEYKMYTTVNGPLKRNLMDRLQDLNLLDCDNFRVEYIDVIDKYSKLSSVLRNFVKDLGYGLYVKTVKDLMDKYDNEKVSTAKE